MYPICRNASSHPCKVYENFTGLVPNRFIMDSAASDSKGKYGWK